MDKMAGYGTDQQYEGSMAGTDIKDMMVQKAHELFSLCDKEEKGFITKRDMQRLQTELPLSPDQLEDVFDSLDDDKNGFLTLEEFTEGFGSFIGLGPPMEKQVSIDSSGAGSEKVYENDHLDSEDEEEHFNDLLGHLGTGEMFDNPELLRSMWGKLRREDPDMLSNFESMLIKITSELKNTRQDYSSLESALRNKLTAHDEELRHLYEEMENQIKAEKDKVIQQEKLRERTMREELERELREKDRALQELINKHNDMEDRLDKLNLMEVETKQENEKLQQEKDSLQEMLDQSLTELTESKSYITQLRNQQRDEKRERAMAALHISEGIAIERESLVKQLELLRDMNKKLRDDKDEAEMKQAMLLGERAPHLHRDASCENNSSVSRGPSLDNQGSVDAASSRKNHLVKQGSILSNYFDRPGMYSGGIDDIEDDGIECDDVDYVYTTTSTPLASHPGRQDINRNDGLLNNLNIDGNTDQCHLTSQGQGQTDHLKHSEVVNGPVSQQTTKQVNKKYQRHLKYSCPCKMFDEEVTDHIDMLMNPSLPAFYSPISCSHGYRNIADKDIGNIESPRGQPVGATSSMEASDSVVEINLTNPERVFKVVFVGDSGVGKSSFIYRFCNNEFKASFSATIGVDFQVKSLVVEGHCVALQLWDTAGQERFRSITKQYFRKADGVLIMYDVTSEVSFTNVRNWMESVQEGTEQGTVLVLVGNKIDLCENESDRAVSMKDGSVLADEYGALFYETSAKSGDQVQEALQGMASLLQEREDRQMEQALSLTAEGGLEEKKKGCCS